LKPQKLLCDEHDCTAADAGKELDVTRGLYAAVINYLDRTVSRYVTDFLDVSAGPTTVVITANHREGLGFASERHQLFHPSAMTDTLMHVPLLVINLPAGALIVR
jgi:arylsulfatase A-like enzyme